MKEITLVFEDAPKNVNLTFLNNLLTDIECLYYLVYSLEEKEGFKGSLFLRRTREKLAKKTNINVLQIHYGSPLELTFLVVGSAVAFSIVLMSIATFYHDILLAKDKHDLMKIFIEEAKKGNLKPEIKDLIYKAMETRIESPSIIKRLAKDFEIFGSPTQKHK